MWIQPLYPYIEGGGKGANTYFKNHSWILFSCILASARPHMYLRENEFVWILFLHVLVLCRGLLYVRVIGCTRTFKVLTGPIFKRPLLRGVVWKWGGGVQNSWHGGLGVKYTSPPLSPWKMPYGQRGAWGGVAIQPLPEKCKRSCDGTWLSCKIIVLRL